MAQEPVMDQWKHEVIGDSSKMNETSSQRFQYSPHCRSRAVFRVLVNMHGTSKQDLNCTNDGYRALSAAASTVQEKIEEHLEEHRGITKEQSSQTPDKLMNASVITAPSKHVEQSLIPPTSSTGIWIPLIFCCIFAMFALFIFCSRFVYLETLSNCVNVKLRYPGMYNPPV